MSTDDGTTKIDVRVPTQLLDRIDELYEERGYTSRSESSFQRRIRPHGHCNAFRTMVQACTFSQRRIKLPGHCNIGKDGETERAQVVAAKNQATQAL